MVGFLSFVVVLTVLFATLGLIFVTLDNAYDAIVAAISGSARAPVAVVKIPSRGTRKITLMRPAFAPLRAAALPLNSCAR